MSDCGGPAGPSTPQGTGDSQASSWSNTHTRTRSACAESVIDAELVSQTFFNHHNHKQNSAAVIQTCYLSVIDSKRQPSERQPSPVLRRIGFGVDEPERSRFSSTDDAHQFCPLNRIDEPFR